MIIEKMRPIAAKHGKTLAQMAINWNLTHTGVASATIGARRPSQVKDNAGGSGWDLTTKDLEKIESLVAQL